MPNLTEQLAETQHRDMTGRVLTRADNGNFEGIGISYGETYETPWFTETFEPGCVINDDGDVPILRDHKMGDIVGRTRSAKDTEAGRAITAELSGTALGQDTRTLLNEGMLTGLSVGFRSKEWEETYNEETEIYHVHHKRIEVYEYSLTSFPAYKSAAVTGSRNIETPKGYAHMDDNKDMLTRSELDAVQSDLMEKLNTIERRAEAGEFGGATGNDEPEYIARAQQFEHFGDWVKAITNTGDSRHEDAVALRRDITTSDIPSKLATTPGFIGDLTREITERRPWTNTFSTAPLPAKGMTVDYLTSTRTAAVAEQSAELENLVKGGQFTVTRHSSKVRTFGGAATVSQQVIDRAEAWVLNDLFRAMGIEYGRVTEKATKDYMVAQLDERLAAHKEDASAQAGLDVPQDFTAFDWIDAIVDSAGIFEDRGFTAGALTVSPDIFKQLAHEQGLDGRPLMTVSGTGVNTVGSVDLPKSVGELMRVPVRVLHGTTGRAMFFDPIAIRTLESPGAPFKLQDKNVLNLSEDFAVYGYMAHIAPYPEAILPINFTTAEAAA